MRYHGRRVFIICLCPGLYNRTCIWNVSSSAMHRSWQTRTALIDWSMLSFCFRSSRSIPLTLFSLRTKTCSQSLYLTVWRTKSVADCGNFWISLAFSLVWTLCSLLLPDRLLTVPVSRKFMNSLLTPHFVQLFSRNSSVNLCCVPLQIQTFLINILSSSLNTMLMVDKHCSDVCCDEFPMPQIDHKNR